MRQKKHILLQLGIVLVYAGIVGATVWWVFYAKIEKVVPKLEAELAPIPGGIDLIIITNKGEKTWHDVHVILDEQYLFHMPELASKKQVTVNVDQLKYSYFTPYAWDHGAFAPLAVSRKKPLLNPANVELPDPYKVQVQSREGQFESTVSVD